MSKQVTMWGNVYNIIPDKLLSESCPKCCFYEKSIHKQKLKINGIYPCSEHFVLLNKDCEYDNFHFTLAEEAKP